MKIGILTYHRTHNHGGCLQAFATRVILEMMGHHVYYVDYWPEYHSNVYSGYSLKKLLCTKGIKNKIHITANAIRYGKYRMQREENFLTFINREIEPYCKQIEESYDVVIYGSDQIWRKQPILNDYNPIYFADNKIKANKHVALSASMGILPIDECDKVKVVNLVSHFDEISVREQDLQHYLSNIGFGNVTLTLDPTLLLTRRFWDNYLPYSQSEMQKYVLLYALHDTFDKEKIYKFAKERHLSVKELYGTPNHKETSTKITTAGPDLFLSLIKNAEYVFSSSFHGLAFSLIFEKEFFVSLGSNAGRARSLLNMIGLSDRFMYPQTEIPIHISMIDYSVVNQKLASIREQSLSFLKKALI